MRSSLYVTLTVALAASPLALALPSQGSGSPHQQLAKRAAAASIFSPAGAQKNNYALLGCYNDLYPNSRALNGAYSDNPSGGQTIGKCLSFCASQGGYLAGLENGNQCFCGSQLDPASKVTQPANGISVSNNGGCSTPCAGNSTQDCGGPNRLLIFQSNTGVPAKIGTVPNANYKGCVSLFSRASVTQTERFTDIIWSISFVVLGAMLTTRISAYCPTFTKATPIRA